MSLIKILRGLGQVLNLWHTTVNILERTEFISDIDFFI